MPGRKKKAGKVIKAGWETKVEQALLKRLKEASNLIGDESAREALMKDQDKLMTESFMIENASCFLETSAYTESSADQQLKHETKDPDQSFTGDINFGAEMEEEESKQKQSWVSPAKPRPGLKLDLDKMSESITSVNKSAERATTERGDTRLNA